MFEFEKDEVYCRLVRLVLNSEGGYVNDPDDPGGPTMYGVAWNYNESQYRSVGIDHPSKVKNLTQDQAKQIYYRKYYLAACCEQVAKRSIRLAYIHFDAAVNHGVGQAAKFLRQVMAPHGGLGAFAGGGANKAFWLQRVNDYWDVRMAFYKQIKKGGGWKKYGKGWTNRMNRIVRQSNEMPW